MLKNKQRVFMDFLTTTYNFWQMFKKSLYNTKYSILVPNDEHIESYKNIEIMDKKYDKNIDAYYVGMYNIQ
jgi:hypothetical protein